MTIQIIHQKDPDVINTPFARKAIESGVEFNCNSSFKKTEKTISGFECDTEGPTQIPNKG